MSRHEYEESKRIERGGFAFYSLIMAAMRQADSGNILKLRTAFPDVWDELRERYDVPGGFLQGEGPRDEPDEVPMCGNLYPNFKVKMGVVEGIWKCEKPKGHDTAEGHQNGALCWSDRG